MPRVSRRFAIAAMDQAVNSRMSLSVGPVRLPQFDQLRDAFVRLASVEPTRRLGYTFADDSCWGHSDHHAKERVQEIIRRAPEGTESLREWIESTWVADLPIQVAVTNDRIGFVADHRLMDGFLSTRFIPLLISVATGQQPPVSSVRQTPRPLLDALTNTYLRHPSTGIKLMRHWRNGPASSSASPSDTNPLPRDLPVPTGVGARHIVRAMDHARLRELREWSRGRITLSAALLLLAGAGFRSVGVPLVRYGGMVVDLRRYLPPTVTTTGNFIAGMPLPLTGPGSAPEEIEARVSSSLAVGRPLLAACKVIARGFVPRRRSDASTALTPQPATSAGPIQISLSNSGLLRAVDRLTWLAPAGSRIIEGLGDAVIPSHVGFLTYMADGRLWFGGSYRAQDIEPALVEASLEAMVTHPADLLAELRH